MSELTYVPGAIARILEREAVEPVADVTFGYRGRDLMEPPGLVEFLRRRLVDRQLELLSSRLELSTEHATPAAWQGELSTGILGALVPSCPDGVGVLSFGVDAAMRQRRLRTCSRSPLRKTIRFDFHATFTPPGAVVTALGGPVR